MTLEMELVVDAAGDVRCIYDEGIDLRELGALKITRASHVEPDADGLWCADMGPVGGPVMGPFGTRSEALAAERAWLMVRGGRSRSPSTPLYMITTWDYERPAFTTQQGLSVPTTNVSWRGLLAAVRELKAIGYSCHRVRAADGTHDDNDCAVMIERVDGGRGAWFGIHDPRELSTVSSTPETSRSPSP
jgi:hypothetical protein